MKTYKRIIFAILGAAAALGGFAQPDKAFPTGQSVGLVLSGGGAKGIAHIGVIQALEEHDIPIDYIAGTSMGSIVGGLYAAGYTPREMLQLILSKSFNDWSTGQIDQNLTYYFIKRPETPAFAHIHVPLGKRDSTEQAANGIMPSSLISPLPMNFAFMDLFSAYTAQCGGDFDRLFVPFRCVTSDVFAKHKVVLRGGLLGDAIRMSMSFPAVFEPIELDGVPMYDGGIYDNFPTDVMREDFAPDIMLGIDVHDEGGTPSNGIVTQLENMIIQNNDYYMPPEEGIHIHIDCSQFSLLDFGKADQIYAIGYRRAMEFMDSIERRVTSRVPGQTRRLRRQVFKSATPYVRFDSVRVTGGTPRQNSYLEHLFMPEGQERRDRRDHRVDTFGIAQARLAYYRALSPGRLQNLFPQAHYNPATGLFRLDMQASIKNNFSLGAGGYLTSASNSMIFVSADYASMSLRSAETRLMGWLGQSYMAAQWDGRVYLNTSVPSAFHLEGVISRRKFYETDKLFYEDNTPAFITKVEGFGRLSYGWALGRSGKASVGVGGAHIREDFYANDRADFRESGREQTVMNLGQAIGRMEFNTLNHENYPSQGYFLNLTAMGLLGRYHYRFRDNFPSATPGEAGGVGVPADPGDYRLKDNVRWLQAELKAAKYFYITKQFRLGVTADILASTRKLLNTYYASVVNAPEYAPTPSMHNVFNKSLRANSFAAVGLVPIWQPFDRVQARLRGDLFMPFRRIEPAGDDGLSARHGRWFHNPEFVGELDVVVTLPFASLCGYLNYTSYPAHNWNVGLSFGLFFTAGKFLR